MHERELTKGNRNRATLGVARKLVAYMFAVDKKQRKFIPWEPLAMKGQLSKQIDLEVSYWTRDDDKVLADYLEDGEDPGISRFFYDTDKGFVRAVRSLN